VKKKNIFFIANHLPPHPPKIFKNFLKIRAARLFFSIFKRAFFLPLGFQGKFFFFPINFSIFVFKAQKKKKKL
jgi:hypothetical protein